MTLKQLKSALQSCSTTEQRDFIASLSPLECIDLARKLPNLCGGCLGMGLGEFCAIFKQRLIAHFVGRVVE